MSLELTINILFFTFLASIFSLIGGLILLVWNKFRIDAIHLLVSFAAGVLLGATFFELLPESLEYSQTLGQEFNLFLWILLGITLFYVLERMIHWYTHHQKINKGKHGSVSIPLVIFGDSLHNFVDGIAIAVTFLVNPALGFTTALAIIAHEIPQEIGDFAILLHEGMSRKKVLLFNILSSATAFLGAIITVLIGERIEGIIPYALALTAGFFIYIALTNLLPEIHSEEKKGYAFWETTALLGGIVAIYVTSLLVA